jgi:hypothetical protein
MSLRLVTAALVGMLFLLAGFALGQTGDPPRRTPEASSQQEQIERIRERERTGVDANVATGTFGTTERGSASGAADSAPAENRRGAGDETMSEPAGPASADRRPGTAVGQ